MAQGTAGSTGAIYACRVSTPSLNPTKGAEVTDIFFDGNGGSATIGGVHTRSVDAFGGRTTQTVAQANCNLTSSKWNFNDCIWKPVMATLGQAWLTVGAYVLMGAGYLFDMLVKNVIVDFRGLLGPDGLNILGVINTVWTLFRDFANILIIGMFVFIAASLILGLKEYGQKKLIANVIIVAVLLNFSLLFTTLIIDASNFVAKQFYQTMTQSNASFNIAQGFLKPMGITTVWQDAGNITDNIAKKNDSGWEAFLFGLTGGILLIVVALVMLYGCFLIAARGALFLVLMIVSAAAFATYLIPSLSSGQYGFKTWLKTLLNTAIFAPLLMLSLAASLAVIVAAQPKDGASATALGAITANPSVLGTTSAWHTIMLYILGTALLFISFRLSSKFAGTISGFNLASLAALTPLGFAGKFAAGAAGASLRQGAGRIAYSRSEALKEKARTATTRAAFENQKADRFAQQLADAKKTGNRSEIRAAQSRFNEASVLAKRLEAEAAKSAQRSAEWRDTAGKSFTVGKDGKAKSFLQQQEEKAKQASKIAEIARPGAEQQAQIRDQVTKDAKDAQKEALTRAEARNQTASESFKQLDQSLNSTRARFDQEALNAKQALETTNRAQAALIRDHRREEDALLTSIANEQDEAVKATLRNQLANLKIEQQARKERGEEAVREKAAAVQDVETRRKREVDDVLAPAAKEQKEAGAVVDSINKRIVAIDEGRDSATNRTIDAYKERAKQTTVEVAGLVGKKLGNSHVSALAREYTKKQVGQTNRMRDLIKELGANSDTNTNTSGTNNPTP